MQFVKPNLTAAKPQLWTGNFIKFMCVNFAIFVGFDILLPTLTLYFESFGATEAEIGRIYGILVVASITMRMLAARLSVWRISVSNLVRLGLLAGSVAVISYCWARSTPLAMGVRVLQGLGFGLATTLITALASQAIPVSRMGEGMGYLGLGTGLALAVGPFVGVWLKDVYGFRVMFVCVGACYLIASGIFSSIKNVSLPKRKPGSPAPKLVLFSPLVIPQSILMFVLGLIINTILVYMALFCQERGLPHADTFFVLSTIGIVFSRLNAGRIYDHFGHKYIIIPSAILMLLALFLIHQSHTRNFLILAAITYGLAIGGLFPSLQALTMNAAPLEQRTEAAASFLNSYDLGFGLGALMMGQIAQITKSYSSVYLTAIMAGFIFLVIYVFCYLRPKTLNNKTAKK